MGLGPDDARAEGDRRSHPGLPSRVLLVDDEPLITRTMGRALELLNIEVTVARTGEAAMSVLRAPNRVPELVVLDRVLPDTSERDALVEMRREFPRLPVVLVSGYPDDRATIEPNEPTHFLQKPFGVRELVRALELTWALRHESA